MPRTVGDYTRGGLTSFWNLGQVIISQKGGPKYPLFSQEATTARALTKPSVPRVSQTTTQHRHPGHSRDLCSLPPMASWT